MANPYIFGISCVTAAINRGYQLAKILKTRYPGSKVIFGGIHPTVLPKRWFIKPKEWYYIIRLIVGILLPKREIDVS